METIYTPLYYPLYIILIAAQIVTTFAIRILMNWCVRYPMLFNIHVNKSGRQGKVGA